MILRSRIKNIFHSRSRIGSSGIIIPRKIWINNLTITPAKIGVPFSCQRLTITYDLLGSLRAQKARLYHVVAKNIYIKKSPAGMLSGFGNLITANNSNSPIFDEATVNSFRLDKETKKHVFSARGKLVELQGTGTITSNGNTINYKIVIYLKDELAKNFKETFAAQGSSDKFIKIFASVYGQPNNPFINISSEQFKLSFRLNKKHE